MRRGNETFIDRITGTRHIYHHKMDSKKDYRFEQCFIQFFLNLFSLNVWFLEVVVGWRNVNETKRTGNADQ